jgi:hypothetical protein
MYSHLMVVQNQKIGLYHNTVEISNFFCYTPKWMTSPSAIMVIHIGGQHGKDKEYFTRQGGFKLPD